MTECIYERLDRALMLLRDMARRQIGGLEVLRPRAVDAAMPLLGDAHKADILWRAGIVTQQVATARECATNASALLAAGDPRAIGPMLTLSVASLIALAHATDIAAIDRMLAVLPTLDATQPAPPEAGRVT